MVQEARLLPDLLVPWAQSRPDELAISYGDRTWTWSQWQARIGRAGAGLARAGVEQGGRIAVLDKNHPAALELLFAAGSRGAALAILNWRLARGPARVHAGRLCGRDRLRRSRIRRLHQADLR